MHKRRKQLLARFQEDFRNIVNSSGFTKKAIGDATGLHSTYISEVTNQKNDNRIGTLLMIADAIGFDIVLRRRTNVDDH